jgi:hypothetical protein
MVGDSVECSLGCASNEDKEKPLNEKRGKDTYQNAVSRASKKFLPWASAYIHAYLVLEMEAIGSCTTTTQADQSSDPNSSVPIKIKQMVISAF